jgi:hypothetical protein
MADFRLIIISIILSVFSIASNTLLIKNKEHLKKSELNFAIVSLVGSLVILMASMFFGFKNKGLARNKAAERLMNASGFVRGY